MTKTRRTAIMVTVLSVGIVTVVAARVRAHEKETTWAMYADIHNLATSQAAYYNDHSSFANAKDLGTYYSPEHGATVVVTSASDTSWAATETRPSSSKVCSISYAEPRNATRSQISEARGAAMASYTCK